MRISRHSFTVALIGLELEPCMLCFLLLQNLKKLYNCEKKCSLSSGFSDKICEHRLCVYLFKYYALKFVLPITNI
jgi:hypothetical protein